MKKSITFFVFLFAFGLAFSQDYSKEEIKKLKSYFFNEGFDKPATQKISTLILKDGTTIKGQCRGIITKRGQIAEMNFKDSITDKKTNYNADQIAEAYLFASGFEKFNKTADYFSNYGIGKRKNVSKMTTNDEIYFVNQKVSLKNKRDEKEFLMQLINPDFADFISVYHDPFAKETQGFSVGGSPTFGGGIIKSYYVKKGDKVLWLPKSDFEENYEFLFGDNPEFMAKYPYKAVDWDWFSALVLEYTLMSLGEAN